MTDAWIEYPKPQPKAAVRLVCFPHAGASPRSFYPWADELPDSVELLPICLPGRAGRSEAPLMTSVKEIVEPLALALAHLMDEQVVFFGHSLGALLALELVLELRRRGSKLPTLLVVSGRTIPGMGRTLKLHSLPDTQLVREVQRIYGGIPRELLVEPAMLMRMLPVLRADLAVNETYRHVRERPVACSILALGGTTDPHVTGTELELWRGETTGKFQSAQFNGGHFYLTTPEGSTWVLDKIMRGLERLPV